MMKYFVGADQDESADEIKEAATGPKSRNEESWCEMVLLVLGIEIIFFVNNHIVSNQRDESLSFFHVEVHYYSYISFCVTLSNRC